MEKQGKQQDAEREQLAKSKSLVKNKLVVAAIALVCAVALVMGGYFTYSAYIANGFLKSVAATMHSYLQSAYYSIELENDKGGKH